MKKSTMLAMLLTPAALFADPSVERVIVRQQWPWSTDVKVEYSLSGVGAAHPVDISVRAFNDGVELPSANLDAAITGDRYGITDAVGSLTIDPVKAFGTEQVALGSFTVQLSLSASSASTTEVLYKIIDLDNFTEQNVRRADFMNGKMGDYETSFSAIDSSYWTSLSDVLIWTGVTNAPEYKTSKMVLRRIPAKNVTFAMGNISGAKWSTYCNGTATVTLTNDFYIGVFEVTEAQYKRMTAVNGTHGSSPSASGDSYPVGKVSYNALRGAPANWSDWPADPHCVAANTAIAKLRANMSGRLFDLPTEAQWEYACRAGTTNDTYIGYSVVNADSLEAKLAELAWYSGNSDLTKHIGGLKRPNAFGLYDTLGNMAEHCRDLISGTGTSTEKNAPNLEGTLTEPYGMSEGTDASWNINKRGGYYGCGREKCACQVRRLNTTRSSAGEYLGFRLWLLDENDTGSSEQ